MELTDQQVIDLFTQASDLLAVDTFAGGGKYMGFAEYKEWIKGGATMVDTPAFATAPDTFAAVAADRIWGKPQGVDNRWIRGVR
jgi:hypothetical protein